MTQKQSKKDCVFEKLSEKPDIIKKIFGYLDCGSLNSAQNVCCLWRKVVRSEKLWKQVYERNIQLAKWRFMEVILKAKDPITFPSKDSPSFYETSCCLIAGSIQKLEKNWIFGNHSDRSFTITKLTAKLNANCFFYMNERWVLFPLPDGRISTVPRWTSPESEETPELAEMMSNKNIPLDNGEFHPIIESIQGNQDYLVAIGKVDTRTILFVFQVKKRSDPFMLRCWQWRKIEQRDIEGILYSFDAKNCIRLKDDLLLLCGTKNDNKNTVVTLMNPREAATIFQNLEVPAKYGTVEDFAVDDRRIVLFFKRKENPRLRDVLRYLIQIRDLSNFDLLQSFVLPLVKSCVCHFSYSNGYVITGSNDSPIRIWNVSEGTCDGDFDHGGSISAIRIVGDKFILTCDQKGKVSVWSMSAALDPSLRGNPRKMLINKLSAPVSPYTTYRKVSVLSMEADELQIVLLLKYDNKAPVLYVMDFLADNDKENVRTQPSRKRRSQ